jgi:hypothetical protein
MRRNKEPLDVSYLLNTRKNVKSTIERMIVNYNPKKTTVQKSVPSLYGFEGNHIKLSTTKAKEMITSTMSTFDQLSDKEF